MNILDTARGYVAAGLSVIPVRADGSKAPKLPGWRAYTGKRPTDSELVAWFGSGQAVGIGVPCGPASGNLAVLDLETAAVWNSWFATIPADTADFLADCPIVRTPSGGAHVWVRLPEPVPGTVLARERERGVLIETRGEGHQVLAPGCPASCHPTGKTYTFEQRGFLDGGDRGEVPLSVWIDWLDNAAKLSEYNPPVPDAPVAQPTRERTDDDPGTDFNRRGSWEEAGLFAAGWRWARHLGGERGFIRRPGKADGISGTVGMVTSSTKGWPLLFAFSTNGAPFEQNRGYDRFGVFARLKHSGDFKAAARDLASMGYGKPTPAAVRPVAVPVDRGVPQVEIAKVDKVTNGSEPPTGVVIILEHFRERYRPVFRRGNAVFTEGGETVPMGTAVAVPDSKLIGRLAEAHDAPRFKGGGVCRDRLPAFFNAWAKTAWGDLLASLPDEDSADAEGAELARDDFRRLVRDAMLTEVQLGDYSERGPAQIERRSLIDWCERFAKPGPWRSIRSKQLWCRLDVLPGGEIKLKVAIRHDLFAQIKADRRLCEMGSNTFTRRAAKYGVGTTGGRTDRPHGLSAIVLNDDFVGALAAGFFEEIGTVSEAATELF